MAETISLTLDVKAGDAIKSTETIKTQLRQAVKEAQALAAAGKENSKEYAEAVRNVAQVQDKMRDFNETLGALDPGKKFQAIGGIASGIAGGIQAATGMMALFGKESEEVQKALLKVQAASAIAQGVDQVRDLGKYFNLAKVAIMGGVESMSKMRLALIATGVGAFSVAVGAIATNWDKVKAAIDKTFPSLGGVANLFDNFKKVAMGSLESVIEGFRVFGEVMGNILNREFSKAVEAAGTFGARVSDAYTKGFIAEEKAQAEEREQSLIDSQIKAHNRQLKLLEAQAKDTYALRKKILEEELRLLQFQKGKESEEYKDKYNEIEVLELQRLKEIQDKKDKLLAEFRAKDKETQITTNMEVIGREDEKEREIVQIKNNAGTESLLNTKTTAEMEMDIKQRQADATISLAGSSAQSLSALGNALIKNQEKNARFQKAVAMFQIGADTAQGIAGIIKTVTTKTPDPTGITQAALIGTQVASLLIKVAGATRILNSNSLPSSPTMSVPSFGGGGGGGVNVPNISNAPNNVSTQVVGGNNTPPLKAYVVENEITESQRRIRGIEERATFG
jgi:hypothetical protein